MDRRSYKKIVRYIIIWLIIVCICSIGTGILIKTENRIYRAQKTEMIAIHPEQEQELIENFDYYAKSMNQKAFYFCIFFMLVSIFSASAVYCLQKKNGRKKKQELDYNLNLLSEQLNQYKKGNYKMIQSITMNADFLEKTEEWIKIEDSLRELGYYFDSLKEQLEKEENSTKSLISDISHQLKTPLSALRVSHELAQETDLSQEERTEFLKQEEQKIHKLEVLLEELVNLSRLESHIIQIKPERTGIKKTLTEAVNQVFMKAYSKSIKLQVDMDEDTDVYHDTKWTVEAISNVLDNAIKYSDVGTCVSISVHKLPNMILIDVEDEGIGIPTDELHKIFHRFFRGKNASSQVKEGAGIGLYLTRKILEEQGGTIVAKRKYQKGTVFRITLPI